MDDRMKPARDLLREAARASDDEAAGKRTARAASQRALSAWEDRQARRSPRLAVFSAKWALVVFAAAAVLMGVLVAGLWSGSQQALSFVVAPAGVASAAGEPGQVGAWIASPPRGLSLRFSEGSEIVLQAGASARVARADERGADVLLERGALDASVVHRDHTTGWSVHAGPFEIRIVGTRFDASWEPSSGTLDVHVTEGRVIVVGPLLDEGRGVGAEERLRVSLQTSRFEMTRTPSAYAAATDTPAASAQPGAASAEPSPGVAPAAAAASSEPAGGAGAGGSAVGTPAAPTGGAGGGSATSSRAAVPAGGAGWRELARAGQHRAAIDAAVAQGYEGVLGGAPAADLLLLADSARFAGEAGRARQALLAARRRGAKGSSAFLLGKIAADSAASPGEAAQWFETYLAEAPSGGLAEQALGRLIEARRRAGQTEAARVAATRYLERYPSGGYAAAARAILAP